jgi:hypothetical protein
MTRSWVYNPQQSELKRAPRIPIPPSPPACFSLLALHCRLGISFPGPSRHDRIHPLPTIGRSRHDRPHSAPMMKSWVYNSPQSELERAPRITGPGSSRLGAQSSRLGARSSARERGLFRLRAERFRLGARSSALERGPFRLRAQSSRLGAERQRPESERKIPGAESSAPMCRSVTGRHSRGHPAGSSRKGGRMPGATWAVPPHSGAPAVHC